MQFKASFPRSGGSFRDNESLGISFWSNYSCFPAPPHPPTYLRDKFCLSGRKKKKKKKKKKKRGRREFAILLPG